MNRPVATLAARPRRLGLLFATGVAVGLVHASPMAAIPQAAVQQPVLMIDHVTVVDVEQGTLIPEQRVVIVGDHIQSLGDVSAVAVSPGARIVDGHGKYLISGLWDSHIHPHALADIYYPLLLANGVTGIRDAGSLVPLDTLRQWRAEILAGTRVGPPRQILSGPSIDGPDPDCARDESRFPTCVADTADARRLVDSLARAGADMIKAHALSSELYFAIAAEARRLRIPFGGHVDGVTADQASDSGARVVDHFRFKNSWYRYSLIAKGLKDLVERCVNRQTATVERCREEAEKFRRQDTWVTMDGIVYIYETYPGHKEFWSGRTLPAQWLRDSVRACDSTGILSVIQQVNFPMVAGADLTPLGVTQYRQIPGFLLQANLAAYVAAGLTPLAALRSATLNPARMLHRADSLGTVAVGKLADLVLLDADPLADITNITAIRAVVANGHYFDRAALDRLLAEGRAKLERTSNTEYISPAAPEDGDYCH